MSYLGVGSILEVGVVVARSIHNDHVLELLALNFLGYGRWALFALENSVANFPIITFFKVIHNIIGGGGFSVTDLSKDQNSWLPLFDRLKAYRLSHDLYLLEQFCQVVEIIFILDNSVGGRLLFLLLLLV